MKRYVTFFAMLLFAFLYTYYVGAQTSMLVVLMFVLSIPLSFFMTCPLKKLFEVQIDFNSSEVEKDGIIKAFISIKNKSFIPVPFVYIDFLEAENLTLAHSINQELSFAPYEEKKITIQYRASYRGIGEIGIKSLVIRDYLGFFSFSLTKKLEAYQYIGKVTVLPRITQLNVSKKIIQGSGNTNTTREYEASPAGVNSWIGEPGHEYREYQAGDQLHRVHWKLSAKIDKLMVRKNDSSGVSKKSIVIDPYIPSENNITNHPGIIKRLRQNDERQNGHSKRAIEEKLLETALSVANMLIQCGQLAQVWIYENNQWQANILSNRKELLQMQQHLAQYQFIGSPCTNLQTRVPMTSIAMKGKMSRHFEGGNAIVLTGCYDKKLQQSLDSFYSDGFSLELILVKDTNNMVDVKKHNPFNPPQRELLLLLNPDDNLIDVVI